MEKTFIKMDDLGGKPHHFRKPALKPLPNRDLDLGLWMLPRKVVALRQAPARRFGPIFPKTPLAIRRKKMQRVEIRKGECKEHEEMKRKFCLKWIEANESPVNTCKYYK